MLREVLLLERWCPPLLALDSLEASAHWFRSWDALHTGRLRYGQLALALGAALRAVADHDQRPLTDPLHEVLPLCHQGEQLGLRLSGFLELTRPKALELFRPPERAATPDEEHIEKRIQLTFIGAWDWRLCGTYMVDLLWG